MTGELPSYLAQYQNAPAVSDVDALTSVKTSVPRVSLKGKRFKWIDGDEESKGTESIEVAILAVEPPGALMNKVFYKGGYNPQDTAPPDCASSNGVNPDAWVSEPQAELCARCPNNMFGSATSTTGKKAKACKDSKVLWVAKPDEVGGTVYGLKIPVTSIKSMAEFGKQVKSIGVPLAVVRAKLSMDQDLEYPMVQFENAGFLDEVNGPKAVQRSQEREWIQDNAPMLERASAAGQKQTITYTEKAQQAEPVTIEHAESNADFNEIANKW